MQILITHDSRARTRVLQFSWWRVAAIVGFSTVLLMLASGAVYHFIFLKAAREGWPIVSQIVKLVVRDEIAQRDRFMRENLDAMAQHVGEMHAKLIKLEAMGERVSGLAGVKVDEMKSLPRPATDSKDGGKVPGAGGPFIPAPASSLEALRGLIVTLDESTEQHTDLFTLVESRLLQARLKSLMVPNSRPIEVPVGSGFGFRQDPISGRAALHSGLDFPSDVGTPIRAAAGGVVIASEWHAAYGQVLEINHGNGLVTRYAHCSKVLVEAGVVVKRGQVVAEVGTSGRSTGPHLHFEVLLEGVPQDPAQFLDSGNRAPITAEARPRR